MLTNALEIHPTSSELKLKNAQLTFVSRQQMLQGQPVSVQVKCQRALMALQCVLQFLV